MMQAVLSTLSPSCSCLLNHSPNTQMPSLYRPKPPAPLPQLHAATAAVVGSASVRLRQSSSSRRRRCFWTSPFNARKRCREM